MSQYDFNTLYGRADHSGQTLYDRGEYDGVIESSTWGRSKDGTKGQWSIKIRFSTGPYAGQSIMTNITISPDNDKALGIMFRHMAAMQVAWQQATSEEQMAQMMVRKPILFTVTHDEYNGVMRPKVGDIRPARPGAPVSWPQPQQQAPPQQFAGQAGYAQPVQQGYDQPGFQGYQPQWQQPQQQAPPQGQQAPPPWQPPQQAPQQMPGYSGDMAAGPGSPPAQQLPPGQPQIPGAPPWAQPPAPGQGGYGQFTPEGAGYQPNLAQPQPQQPPAPVQQGAPPPPWEMSQQAAQQPPMAPPGAPGQAPPPQWQPPQAQNGYAPAPQGQPQPQQPEQPPPPPATPWQ